MMTMMMMMMMMKPKKQVLLGWLTKFLDKAGNFCSLIFTSLLYFNNNFFLNQIF